MVGYEVKDGVCVISEGEKEIEDNTFSSNPDSVPETGDDVFYGGNSWSRVTEFNGNHILDMLLAPNGKDIEVYTDRYVYIRDSCGGVRKK